MPQEVRLNGRYGILKDAIVLPPGVLFSETAHGQHLVRVAVEGKLDDGVPGEVLDIRRVCTWSEQYGETGVLVLTPPDSI
jgi:hypothetical protein